MTTKRNLPSERNWHEHQAWNVQRFVCGIDEAGRGALAGPVVIAAAVVPVGTTFHLLKDSKKMSVDQRNEAYDWLQKNAWTSSALVDHWHIDRHNIYQATLYGMRQVWLKLRMAYPGVAQQIDRITVDAMPLKLVGDHPPIHSFCYGETYSTSIAAASIIAKVTRDRVMEQLDSIARGYGLSKHKGYGTADHCTSLSEQGASLIHRTSFIDHFVREKDTQKGIFDL